MAASLSGRSIGVALIPLLLDALSAGAIRLEYGQIRDRCGYVDLHNRTIVLNPDAALDEIEAELVDDLAHLLQRAPVDADRPRLHLELEAPDDCGEDGAARGRAAGSGK